MNKKEIAEYISFMNDPKNIGNCKNCPAGNGQHRGCGQQNCWVSCHCAVKETE